MEGDICIHKSIISRIIGNMCSDAIDVHAGHGSHSSLMYSCAKGHQLGSLDVNNPAIFPKEFTCTGPPHASMTWSITGYWRQSRAESHVHGLW
jgi:hypothetical protein